MAAPVRFPSGHTNVGPTDPLGAYIQSDPTLLTTYWNDFHQYVAADWTVTETDAAATQACLGTNAGGHGGILALTQDSGGSATAVNQIQYANENFILSTSKRFWLKTRFSLTAGTMANFGALVGLAITDTTAVAGVSDGIFFRKPTGGSTLSAVLCLNSTETTIAMSTSITTATYYTAALYYNGKDEVSVWLDGTKVGSTTTLTNLVTDEELAVTIASLNATAAAANVLSVDYVLVSMDR